MTNGKNKQQGSVGCNAPRLNTPLLIDIEDLAKSAIALREKMQAVLWDTSFEMQFGDDIDAMHTDINSIIAHCAPLLGWAKLSELGD